MANEKRRKRHIIGTKNKSTPMRAFVAFLTGISDFSHSSIFLASQNILDRQKLNVCSIMIVRLFIVCVSIIIMRR